METTSLIASLVNGIKSFFPWILKKFGVKLVKIDNYVEETELVTQEYVDQLPEYIQEAKNEARFYWSDARHPGYEKFYVEEGNKRIFYKKGNHFLWIKRPNKNHD